MIEDSVFANSKERKRWKETEARHQDVQESFRIMDEARQDHGASAWASGLTQGNEDGARGI